jgi:hypothetical protein
MKVKGIIQGKSIQLSEAVSVPDGTEVMVEIPDRSLNQKIDQWQKLQEVIGAWKDDPEIEQIFTEIDRERHAYRGRDIDKDAFE